MDEDHEFYFALKNIPEITPEMEQALIKRVPFINQNSSVMVSSYDITCMFVFMDYYISYIFDYSFEDDKYQKSVMWCSNGDYTNEHYLDTYNKILELLNTFNHNTGEQNGNRN